MFSFFPSFPTLDYKLFATYLFLLSFFVLVRNTFSPFLFLEEILNMVSLLFFGCGFISSTLTYLAYFLELTHFRNLNFTRSSEPFFHVLMKIFSMCFTFFVSLISHGFFHTNFSGCGLNISQIFTSVSVWMFSIIFTGVLVQTDHTKMRHYNAIRQCYIIVDQEVSPCNK